MLEQPESFPTLSPEQIEALRDEAISGDVDAQFNLGVVAYGRGEPQSTREAARWWSMAASAGDADAQFNLGMLLTERGDCEDRETAKHWFHTAAVSGHVEAQYNLGVLLDEAGDVASRVEAEQWWRRAAERGHGGAAHNLATNLDRRADPEAEQWWRVASEAGHPGARVSLGALLYGRGDERSRTEARRLFAETAESGDPDAQFSHANVLRQEDRTGGSAAAVEHWLLAAAEQGHADAQHLLGSLAYQQDSPNSVEIARYWWVRASRTGHPDALHDLGALHYYRDDLEQAERCWRTAAQLGHVSAAFHLAVAILSRGENDVHEGERWLAVAAAAGHGPARTALQGLQRSRSGSATATTRAVRLDDAT